MLPDEEDPLSASALARWAQQETCRHLTPPPVRPPMTSLAAGLRGLACRHNRSLSLLALDSALFGHFAQGLGVDPELVRGHTRVLLVNSKVKLPRYLFKFLILPSLESIVSKQKVVEMWERYHF